MHWTFALSLPIKLLPCQSWKGQDHRAHVLERELFSHVHEAADEEARIAEELLGGRIHNQQLDAVLSANEQGPWARCPGL